MGTFADDPTHEVFHNTLLVVTALDLLMQLYTVFLITRVSATQMSRYRYFLLFSTSWDICFTVTLGFIMQPRVLLPEVACASVRSIFAVFGDPAAGLIHSALYFLGTAIVCSQYYSLAYRVALVSGRRLKDAFTRWYCVIPCVLVFFTACLAVGLANHSTVQSGRVLQELRADLVRRGLLTDEDISVVCIDIFARVGQVVTKAVLCAFAVSEALCLAAAGWLIWRVNRQTAYSSRTKAMHLQLTWLLIAQMLSPVICMFIPMTAIALNGVLRLDLGLPVIYLSLLFFSLFPMVNAVFTVGFVAPYRRFTLDLLRQTVKVSAAQYSFTTAQSGMHGARRDASIPRVPS